MPDRLQQIVGAAMLLATLPFVVILGILVKLDSDGPALHRATRGGSGGKPFTCYKLRTMRVRPASAAGTLVSVADDPRVTRLGRYLRRTRLDEIPQFWNVAFGQMRLVGPRPEDLSFIDWTDPLHRLVFSAKPGLTGLSQLLFLDEASGLHGSSTDVQYRRDILPRKLRVDAAYLARRSSRLDLLLLRETIRYVFTGARRTELLSQIVP